MNPIIFKYFYLYLFYLFIFYLLIIYIHTYIQLIHPSICILIITSNSIRP